MTETGSLAEDPDGSGPGTCSPSSTASSSSTSSGGGSSSSGSIGNGSYFKKKGKCKWFNVAKGWGFITPNDGSQEVFVHQSVIQMTGFRSLGEDEEVEFECKESGKGLEATLVTGPSGGDCHGSNRRPVSKRKLRKIRCYNCGDLSHHIASKCSLGPQPKRCHNCKGEDHLIADCPTRIEKRITKKTKNGSICDNGTSSIETVSDSGTHITAEEFNTEDEEEDDDDDGDEENCNSCG